MPNLMKESGVRVCEYEEIYKCDKCERTFMVELSFDSHHARCHGEHLVKSKANMTWFNLSGFRRNFNVIIVM